MIKKTILALACVMIVSSAFSQLSISLDNKYGFNMLGSYSPWGYGNSNSNGSSTTYTSKKFCFGSGYQGGLDFRYGFKGGFGVNLGGAYLLGTTSKTTSKSNSGGTMPYINDGYSEIKSRLFRVSIGGSYIGAAKISPIIKMAVVMGMGKITAYSKNVTTSTQYSYNPNPPYNSYTITTTDVDEQEVKYYGGISWGFSSALGVNYKVNDNLSLALCLDVIVQEFAPKKGIILKSIQNGVDQLPTMLKSEKEVEFVKEYTEVNAPPTNAFAGKSTRMSLPVSSFGPSFSISYTLGKKKEASGTSETKQQ